jgi:hypothetical protein
VESSFRGALRHDGLWWSWVGRALGRGFEDGQRCRLPSEYYNQKSRIEK